MREATDEHLLVYARRDGRVFVTAEAAVLRLHQRLMKLGLDHAGILFLDYPTSPEQTASAFALVSEAVLPEEMHNRVLFLSDLIG